MLQKRSDLTGQKPCKDPPKRPCFRHKQDRDGDTFDSMKTKHTLLALMLGTGLLASCSTETNNSPAAAIKALEQTPKAEIKPATVGKYPVPALQTPSIPDPALYQSGKHAINAPSKPSGPPAVLDITSAESIVASLKLMDEQLQDADRLRLRSALSMLQMQLSREIAVLAQSNPTMQLDDELLIKTMFQDVKGMTANELINHGERLRVRLMPAN